MHIIAVIVIFIDLINNKEINKIYTIVHIINFLIIFIDFIDNKRLIKYIQLCILLALL